MKNTPSIEQMGSGNTPLCSQYKEQVLKSSTSYRNISELPLNIFIECLCDKNYSKLNVENGEAVWMEIYTQYLDLMKDSEQLHLLKLELESTIIATKINVIEYCSGIIELYDGLKVIDIDIEDMQKIAGVLQTVSRVIISLEDDDYKLKIDQAITRSKAWIVQLEQKKEEIKRLVSKAGKSITKGDFDGLLIALSKHMQFHVNKYKIVVSEFVNMILDMKATAKAMEVKYGK